VEPLGYLIRVSEWWEFDGSPGTFTIEIGTLETGVSEELHEEMERLIADARPVSRHLVGLSIIQEIHGAIYAAAAYFHERRSLNNFHRDRVITFEQIAE
uniref:phage tail protein I n=1 Tax=Escherichia coli TaxID=562 RepID=UPI00244D7718